MPNGFRRSLNAIALGGLILAAFSHSPAALADCVDYADYLHWLGSGELTPDFYSSFDFGGISIAGDHAYVAAVQYGLQVVDITDRIHPRTIAALPAVGQAYDVKVRGQYAYVAGNGLLVVDISQPESPQIVGSVGVGDPRCLALSGQYAFVTNWGSGLAVVDIGNPQAPVVVGAVDTGYCWGVSAAGGIACVANGNLAIVDVSDPKHCQIIGALETPGFALTVTISGSYALAFDENDHGGGALLVVDISTPQAPWIVSSLDFDGWARGIVVGGEHAYITSGGLAVVDIADPGHPVVVGRAFGGHAVVVALADEYAYVADGNGSIHVIDATSPESPPTVGSVATEYFPIGVAVADDHAYVAEARFAWPHSGQLEIFDVADPAHPQLTGSVSMPEWAFDVAVEGDYAYVVGEHFLQVVDVTDPQQPAVIGSEPMGASAIALSGSYALLNAHPGLCVVDVSDPYDPSPVAELSTAGGVHDLVVVGRLAYLAEEEVGLQIVDISDPTVPRIIATATDPDGGPLGNASSVTVEGDRAYLTDFDSRLLMIDITDQEHPCQGGSLTIRLRSVGTSFGSGVLADNGSLYLASNGLQIVDLTGVHVRPYRLGLTGGIWTGLASRVALSEEHVFTTVDDGWPYGSLQILPRQCGQPTASAAEGPAAPTTRLIAFPNPTGEQTTIRLEFASDGLVSAAIYDASGRHVRSLPPGGLGAGVSAIDWDGRDDEGRTVPAGIYLARATTAVGPCAARVVVLR